MKRTGRALYILGYPCQPPFRAPMSQKGTSQKKAVVETGAPLRAAAAAAAPAAAAASSSAVTPPLLGLGGGASRIASILSSSG